MSTTALEEQRIARAEILKAADILIARGDGDANHMCFVAGVREYLRGEEELEAAEREAAPQWPSTLFDEPPC
jgi:hypothetical protein